MPTVHYELKMYSDVVPENFAFFGTWAPVHGSPDVIELSYQSARHLADGRPGCNDNDWDIGPEKTIWTLQADEIAAAGAPPLFRSRKRRD